MSISDATYDDLLLRFLQCLDPAVSEELLEQLIQEQAVPVVERVVSSKIRGSTGEDVRGEVLADLISRLREWKEAGGDLEAIRDFRAYSAVAAYHGCDKYYRRAFPQRYRLENQLRYMLGKHVRLAIWVAPDGEWLCGNKAWRNNLPRIKVSRQDALWASSRELARLVETIFDESNAPLPFSNLVDGVARHWRISDKKQMGSYDLAHHAPSVETKLAQRGWLMRLWSEISVLPHAQRLSLLLNLRDERGEAALSLLPVAGVATMQQIASVLDMPVDELASIWNGLPLDDLRIAERLGLNRQRVIDLRRTARARLNKLI